MSSVIYFLLDINTIYITQWFQCIGVDITIVKLIDGHNKKLGTLTYLKETRESKAISASSVTTSFPYILFRFAMVTQMISLIVVLWDDSQYMIGFATGIRPVKPAPALHIWWAVIFLNYCIVAPLVHTAGSDTIFVQFYMDPLPGVPGVSEDAPGSTKPQ